MPKALSYLADLLPILSVKFDIQRNDELSGTGDGRIWQAELAPPLWMAEIALAPMRAAEAKQLAARIRALHGGQEPFLLFDPMSWYPQSDPGGALVATSTVEIAAVAGDRNALSLKGLPAGYVLTVGDKMQMSWSSDPVRFAFLEVSASVTANGIGTTASFAVFPHVPPGVVANVDVTLIKPAMQCIIVPGGHNPGTWRATSVGDAGLKVMQKK